MGVEKSIFTSLNISKNKTQSNVDFGCRIELVEDFFKFLVNYFSIQLGHLEVKYLMSPIFHLRIHQKMLTSTKFLLYVFTVFPFFLHNLVQVGYRITGFPLFCSMLFSPMLLERVVTWELLFTRRTNRPLLRAWLTMLLSHMIAHFLLIISKVLTIRARNNSFRAIFMMTSSIRSPVFPTTVLTFDFLVSVKGRHYLKKIGTLEKFQIKNLK